MFVLLEPLVSNDAGAISEVIWQILICLEAAHEEEVRLFDKFAQVAKNNH